MLDQQSFLSNGGLEDGDTPGSHQKLTRCRRISKIHSKSPEDILDIGNNIKQTLDTLSVFHLRLFKGGFVDATERCCHQHPKVLVQKNLKAPMSTRLPALRREYAISGRPGLDPRLLHLETLLNFNILKTGRFLGGLVQKRYFDEYWPYVRPQKRVSSISMQISSTELALSDINQTVSRFLRNHIRPQKIYRNLNGTTVGYAPSLPEASTKELDELVPCDDEEYVVESSSSFQIFGLETEQQPDPKSPDIPSGTEKNCSCLEEENTIILISPSGKEASDDTASWELIISSSEKPSIIPTESNPGYVGAQIRSRRRWSLHRRS